MILKIFLKIKYICHHIINNFVKANVMLYHALIAKPDLRKQSIFLIHEIYNIGVLSLTIVMFSGLFIGIVLAIQGYIILTTYGAESNLGMLVTISLLRELGPVITALLFIGRACSALTAELGSMKVDEQIASLEMMAIDPLRRLIAPRFWAGVISMPLLTIIFISVGIWGSSLLSIEWKNIDEGLFWSVMEYNINWKNDLIFCAIKSIIFGIVVTWIALFNGYHAIPTARGINHATTCTVVYSSLTILVLDFILTVLMFGS